MPQYNNAAEVRAAHPGVYDDLSDQQIDASLAKQRGPEPVNDGALGERYHPNTGDTPDSAFIGELVRTGKEAGIGLLRSPLDLAKGFGNTVLHPLNTLMGLGHTIAHPVDAAMELARNPREAGSQLGQMLLTPALPGATETALAKGPGIVGRGMGAVGRASETAGTSKVLAKARALAPAEALTGHLGAAIASVATPAILEHGGKLLQRGGAALEGLDLASLGRKAAVPEAIATVPESRRLGPARFSSEIPDYGQTMDNASGHWERSPSENPMVPSRRNPSIRGLEDAVGDPNFHGGEGDPMLAGSQPYPHTVEPNAFTGNDVPVIKKVRPIDTFYESDPQARGVGGEIAEGRTTGKFEEGQFGLSHLENNKPYEMPGSNGFYNNEYGPDESFRDLGSEDEFTRRTNTEPEPALVGAPDDSLAALSARLNRPMSPEAASELFNKRFGLKTPTVAETKFGGR